MSAAPGRKRRRRAPTHPDGGKGTPYVFKTSDPVTAPKRTRRHAVATFPQKCGECREWIEVGEPIQAEVGKRWCHPGCLPELDRGEFNPVTGGSRWRVVTRPDGTTHRVLDWEQEDV